VTLPTGGRVAVRYFAGARAAAGVPDELVTLPAGSTLADLVAELVRRHGPDLARVLAASSFLVDEVASRPDRPLDGVTGVDVLPPFAGG